MFEFRKRKDRDCYSEWECDSIEFYNRRHYEQNIYEMIRQLEIYVSCLAYADNCTSMSHQSRSQICQSPLINGQRASIPTKQYVCRALLTNIVELNRQVQDKSYLRIKANFTLARVTINFLIREIALWTILCRQLHSRYQRVCLYTLKSKLLSVQSAQFKSMNYY